MTRIPLLQRVGARPDFNSPPSVHGSGKAPPSLPSAGIRATAPSPVSQPEIAGLNSRSSRKSSSSPPLDLGLEPLASSSSSKLLKPSPSSVDTEWDKLLAIYEEADRELRKFRCQRKKIEALTFVQPFSSRSRHRCSQCRGSGHFEVECPTPPNFFDKNEDTPVVGVDLVVHDSKGPSFDCLTTVEVELKEEQLDCPSSPVKLDGSPASVTSPFKVDEELIMASSSLALAADMISIKDEEIEFEPLLSTCREELKAAGQFVFQVMPKWAPVLFPAVHETIRDKPTEKSSPGPELSGQISDLPPSCNSVEALDEVNRESHPCCAYIKPRLSCGKDYLRHVLYKSVKICVDWDEVELRLLLYDACKKEVPEFSLWPGCCVKILCLIKMEICGISYECLTMPQMMDEPVAIDRTVQLEEINKLSDHLPLFPSTRLHKGAPVSTPIVDTIARSGTFRPSSLGLEFFGPASICPSISCVKEIFFEVNCENFLSLEPCIVKSIRCVFWNRQALRLLLYGKSSLVKLIVTIQNLVRKSVREYLKLPGVVFRGHFVCLLISCEDLALIVDEVAGNGRFEIVSLGFEFPGQASCSPATNSPREDCYEVKHDCSLGLMCNKTRHSSDNNCLGFASYEPVIGCVSWIELEMRLLLYDVPYVISWLLRNEMGQHLLLYAESKIGFCQLFCESPLLPVMKNDGYHLLIHENPYCASLYKPMLDDLTLWGLETEQYYHLRLDRIELSHGFGFVFGYVSCLDRVKFEQLLYVEISKVAQPLDTLIVIGLLGRSGEDSDQVFMFTILSSGFKPWRVPWQPRLKGPVIANNDESREFQAPNSAVASASMLGSIKFDKVHFIRPPHNCELLCHNGICRVESLNINCVEVGFFLLLYDRVDLLWREYACEYFNLCKWELGFVMWIKYTYDSREFEDLENDNSGAVIFLEMFWKMLRFYVESGHEILRLNGSINEVIAGGGSSTRNSESTKVNMYDICNLSKVPFIYSASNSAPHLNTDSKLHCGYSACNDLPMTIDNSACLNSDGSCCHVCHPIGIGLKLLLYEFSRVRISSNWCGFPIACIISLNAIDWERIKCFGCYNCWKFRKRGVELLISSCHLLDVEFVKFVDLVNANSGPVSIMVLDIHHKMLFASIIHAVLI